MRTFALLWTVAFALAVVPVIRFDRRQRIRRAWAEISRSTVALGEAFVELGHAAGSVVESMRGFQAAYRAGASQPRR